MFTTYGRKCRVRHLSIKERIANRDCPSARWKKRTWSGLTREPGKTTLFAIEKNYLRQYQPYRLAT